jgi:two-component sensor histidine kinase
MARVAFSNILLFICFNCALSQVVIDQSGIPEGGIAITGGISVFEDQIERPISEMVLDRSVSFISSELFEPKSNRDIFWVRLEIDNQSSEKVQSIFSFSHLSHVNAYLVKNLSVLEEAYGGEYSKQEDRRLIDARTYVSLDVPHGESILYLKIRQRKNFAPILEFNLLDASYFYSSLQNRTFLQSLVFGSFIILFLYGMILYFGNKHRPYLWLSLTVIFKAVFFAQMVGYLTDVFLPNSPKLAWDILVFLAYGSGITNILLIKDFLNLKTENPGFNRVLNFVLLLLGACCMLVFFVKYNYEDYQLANQIGFLSYIPQGIFLIYMFIKTMPKVPVYKRPVVIGITGFAALTLVTSVNFLFNLEKSYGQYTWNEVIGTLAFLVLYFYTLGQEMQLNEKDKNLALAKINEITQNQKEQLEQTVQKRTNELEESYQQIEIQNDHLIQRNEQIEVLLKEIHHRVKNNLQVISSLLDLQSNEIDDKKTLATLEEGQNRVKAMSLIHQKLYQNKNLETIEFEEYSQLLIADLAAIFKKSKSIRVEIKSEGNTSYDIDTAVPLGLILNELISNAFKYAFESSDGKILVTIKELGNGRHQLTVKDSGPGLPENFDFIRAKSLGLKLVRSLAKQLYGQFDYTYDSGAEFAISFQDTIERKSIDA